METAEEMLGGTEQMDPNAGDFRLSEAEEITSLFKACAGKKTKLAGQSKTKTECRTNRAG